MTDHTVTQPIAPSPGRIEPGQRGRLVIHSKAVENIAVYTAREVPGVQQVGSGLDTVLGRRFPKAEADVAGEHVKVQLDLAVTWPAPLAATARTVRELVRERIVLLAGLTVDAVHVTVAKVEKPDAADERRVQ